MKRSMIFGNSPKSMIKKSCELPKGERCFNSYSVVIGCFIENSSPLSPLGELVGAKL